MVLPEMVCNLLGHLALSQLLPKQSLRLPPDTVGSRPSLGRLNRTAETRGTFGDGGEKGEERGEEVGREGLRSFAREERGEVVDRDDGERGTSGDSASRDTVSVLEEDEREGRTRERPR